MRASVDRRDLLAARSWPRREAAPIVASTQREFRARGRRSGRPFSPATVRSSTASVWQAIYGVADIVGEPEHDPSRSRWAWSYPIRSVTVVTDLNRAPPVEAAGIFPQSLWRHSHIRLTEEQFGGLHGS